MKKGIAILLLALFLYNMMGYYIVFYFQQLSLQKELVRAIDRGEIAEEELIVIKVPVPVYHQVDKGFERVEGRFEHEGRFYEMVKSQLKNDTIYTYCYTDARKAQLYEKLSLHVEAYIGDLEAKKPSKPIKSTPGFIKEYLPDSHPLLALVFSEPVANKANTSYFLMLSSRTLTPVTPPPKAA